MQVREIKKATDFNNRKSGSFDRPQQLQPNKAKERSAGTTGVRKISKNPQAKLPDHILKWTGGPRSRGQNMSPVAQCWVWSDFSIGSPLCPYH